MGDDESLQRCRVFVGNLPPDVDAGTLSERFSAHGTVTNVNLLKGFGFVQFSQEIEAQTAINEQNGTSLNGKIIDVKVAVRKNKKPQFEEHEQSGPSPGKVPRFQGDRGRGRGRGRGGAGGNWGGGPPSGPGGGPEGPHWGGGHHDQQGGNFNQGYEEEPYHGDNSGGDYWDNGGGPGPGGPRGRGGRGGGGGRGGRGGFRGGYMGGGGPQDQQQGGGGGEGGFDHGGGRGFRGSGPRGRGGRGGGDPPSRGGVNMAPHHHHPSKPRPQHPPPPAPSAPEPPSNTAWTSTITNDCEIVCVNKAQRGYAESIEQRLKNLGRIGVEWT